jgi:hypothetical protein
VLALRHQLHVLERSRARRLQLTKADRVLCENPIEGRPSENAWQTTPLWSRLNRGCSWGKLPT